MKVLDGKEVAAFHREQVAQKIAALQAKNIHPELAILLIGEDKPSAMYAKSMQKVARTVGLGAEIYKLDGEVTEDAVLSLIQTWNENPNIFGILPMMPMPTHLDSQRIVNAIAADKDVDGLTDSSAARLCTGRPGLVPCTPRAVMAILDYYAVSLEGKEVVIIGRSNVVGKPLAQLCLGRNATVTLCHSRTRNIKEVTRRADVVIAAVGKAELVTADMIKPGAVVIDVGINRVEGKTVGDVDFDAVSPIAGAITPVPGGVGSVTTMMVLENAVCGIGD